NIWRSPPTRTGTQPAKAGFASVARDFSRRGTALPGARLQPNFRNNVVGLQPGRYHQLQHGVAAPLSFRPALPDGAPAAARPQPPSSPEGEGMPAVELATPEQATEMAPRILVVDDEETIREFLELGLTHEGYHVETAADGPTALRMATRLKPDLI